jgi:hypothetical protein
MVLTLALVLLLNNSANVDTMYLPILKGRVYDHPADSTLFCKASNGVAILATTDLEVRSCSKGTVVKILKMDHDYGFQVIVKNNDTSFVYSMIDSIAVWPNQNIKLGQSLGWKKPKSTERYIIFSVFKREKELASSRFIHYR